MCVVFESGSKQANQAGFKLMGSNDLSDLASQLRDFRLHPNPALSNLPPAIILPDEFGLPVSAYGGLCIVSVLQSHPHPKQLEC